MMPVTKSPPASPRYLSCVTGTTITRCRHVMVIRRFWRRAMSTASRSPVTARRSPRMSVAMIRPTLSTILCIIWRCWNTQGTRSGRAPGRLAARRMYPSVASADGSSDGGRRTTRGHSGPAIDGGFPSARGRTGRRSGIAARRHQLRRGEDVVAGQTGEPAGPARSDILPLPTGRHGRDNGFAPLCRSRRQPPLPADDSGSPGVTMSPDTPTLTTVAPQVLLGNHLKALKLPTFAREYDKVAMESAQDRADYPRYLLRLCELERIDRERRNIERRIRAARFPQTKSLDTFDFTAQPSLNKALVLELARCEWIEKRQNCIALGPSGTGKTHIALALGLAACQKNQSVAFTTAAALVHELMEARDERRLRALQKHLNTVKLLIVDKLGYVPFTAVGSELLFEVFSQRYERGAALVTSNLPFDEWTSVFGSERLTGALLDRLTHHVHILEMNGESFRLATSRKAQRRPDQGLNTDAKKTTEGAATTEIRYDAARCEPRSALLRAAHSARYHDNQPGLSGPLLLTRPVHYHAAIWHILFLPLTILAATPTASPSPTAG